MNAPPDTFSRRKVLTVAGQGAALLALTSLPTFPTGKAQAMTTDADNFYTSDHVTAEEVAFHNQYRMKVAGKLFMPRTMDRAARHPAIGIRAGEGQP